MPGVRVSELMPRQARVLDQMAVVRTLSHGDGNHDRDRWPRPDQPGRRVHHRDGRDGHAGISRPVDPEVVAMDEAVLNLLLGGRA